MKYSFAPEGVCSYLIEFEIEDGIVKNILFTGGCKGNTKGVSRLAEGLPAELIIDKLYGLDCGSRPTSCPDQFARALKAALGKDV
ncbi:MAG: TIGR03905 family TSCPD domain-containing protein [Clostridiales Family XIII bacterium]|jgi:uncharacterized protein (TIGR03905 family)|nr:TIGR03905 family TSCPD domain-containing protein [Clostridiales Family XIII bacterium]